MRTWITSCSALLLTLLLGGGLSAPAWADDPDEDGDTEDGDEGGGDDGDDDEGEFSGYRDVDLVDGGRTKMEDKRDYRFVLVPGISVVPPGAKLRFQVALDDHLTLIVGAGYAGFGYSRESEVDADGDGDPEATSSSSTDWTRYHGLLGVDYMPIGNGMHGFYVGPRVLYRRGDVGMSLFSADVSNVRTVLVGRLLVGYSIIADPGVFMKFGVGGGYRAVASTAGASVEGGGSASTTTDIRHLVGTVELNVGWAF